MKCPNCAYIINLQVDFEKEYIYTDPIHLSETGIHLKVGSCPNCGQIITSVRDGRIIVYPDSSEIDSVEEKILYPLNINRCSSLSIPEEYRKYYNEANSVVFISPKSTATLLRRLLQLLFENVYSIKERSLEKEIEKFCETSTISVNLKEEMDTIRFIGNFGAHPNKEKSTNKIVEVSEDEALWLLEIVEHFLDECFVKKILDDERRNKLDQKLEEFGKQKGV
jgi:hypothetical protein